MADAAPPKDLLPVLSAIASWFRSSHFDYAVIGGAAIGLIAEPRLTQDVDAVAWIDLDDALRLLESAEQFGLLPRILDPLDFVRKSRVLLLRHQGTQINVDISCGVLPFERELIDRAIEFKTKDITVKVASPEDLVITKAVAHRHRDLTDIEKLLEIYPNLDFSRVRFWVTEFAKVLEMPELLNDLEALLKDRRK